MTTTNNPRNHELRDVGALNVESVRDGDRQFVVLAGTLDVVTSAELEAALQRAELTDARLIVVDLRNLDFADSSGVRAIVMAHRSWGSRLAIIRGSQAVQRVFDVQGMADVLPFLDGAPDRK